MKKHYEIFVSCGTQLPFNRLTEYVDIWVKRIGLPKEKILIQIGDCGVEPTACDSIRNLSPDEYKKVFINSKLVISHAGMGTIISALEYSKPIIVVPRQYELKEHRNDHQKSTVREFAGNKGIFIANNQEELENLLDRRGQLEFASIKTDSSLFFSNLHEFIND